MNHHRIEYLLSCYTNSSFRYMRLIYFCISLQCALSCLRDVYLEWPLTSSLESSVVPWQSTGIQQVLKVKWDVASMVGTYFSFLPVKTKKTNKKCPLTTFLNKLYCIIILTSFISVVTTIMCYRTWNLPFNPKMALSQVVKKCVKYTRFFNLS